MTPPATGKLPTSQFRLLRYFVLFSVWLFILVATLLIYFQRQESEFFKQTQLRQSEFFSQVQADFARAQDEASLRDLLQIHENGNVNLTRLFANALWSRDFAPFVSRVQAIDVSHCQRIPDSTDAKGKAQAPAEKKACFAAIGEKIRALKDYPALDAKVVDAMKKSTVFKIKVFDMRGVTVYSSEAGQVGESKGGNAGWRGAALDGKPTSELTHRDKFSAFEGVVENRDLISSYLPIFAPGSAQIVGVFEVYSDVTPFLAQIKATSATRAAQAAKNQTLLAQAATQSEAQVDASSRQLLGLVIGLLLATFIALGIIVRRADGIIRRQAGEREQAQQQLAQSEKMASLGQMVAGVTHQLNTPIAFSQNNLAMVREGLKELALPLHVAQRFASAVRACEGEVLTLNIARVREQLHGLDDKRNDLAMMQEMLADTSTGLDSMRELVQNLRDFTRLDRARLAEFDLNKGLHNVVYLARSVAPVAVAIREDFTPLPPLQCNPSQLNQVFLNLINNAVQAIDGEGTVTVSSRLDGDHVRVDVSDTGKGIAADVLPHIFDNYYTTKPAGEGTGLGLPIARTIVGEHGGSIAVTRSDGEGTVFTVRLPLALGPSPQ